MHPTYSRIALFLCVGTACSSNDPAANATAGNDAGVAFDPAQCRPDVVQADLLSQSAEGPSQPEVAPYWIGPGVDPATGIPSVPAGAIMTTTYLQLRTDAASQERFGQLAGGVIGTLMASPGLVATSIVSSQQCALARTLTIWKDEAAMLAFVASSAHADAVNAVDEVSRGGSITMHWLATGAQDASYEMAARKLLDHDGPVY